MRGNTCNFGSNRLVTGSRREQNKSLFERARNPSNRECKRIRWVSRYTSRESKFDFLQRDTNIQVAINSDSADIPNCLECKNGLGWVPRSQGLDPR